MTRVRLVNDHLTAEVSTAFGAVATFQAQRDGKIIPLFRAAPAGRPMRATDTGCFPLVPFGNRVRDNRFDFGGAIRRFRPNTAEPLTLHGDGWLSQWSLVGVSAVSAEMFLAHPPCDDTPFVYEARQTITLDDGAMSIALSVVNRGQTPLPFGIGLHPYFPLEPGVTLHAPAGAWWEEGEGHLPTKRRNVEHEHDLDFRRPAPIPARWVNNGFEAWTGRADIRWPARNVSLAIECDSLFGHYALFVSDQRYDPAYRGEYFCFEPMSHAIAAFERADLGGLRVLAPGGELRGTVRFIPDLG
jgi:aldose 1-epimerase